VKFQSARAKTKDGDAWRFALGVLDRLCAKGIQVSTVPGDLPDLKAAFNDAITCCGRSGDWERALTLVQECRQRLGSEPDDTAFDSMLHACVLSDRWEAALALLSNMRGMRHSLRSLTLGTLSAVIQTLQVSGELKQAEHLVDEMQEAHLQPDIKIYNALVNALEPGQAKETPKWVRDNWGKAPNRHNTIDRSDEVQPGRPRPPPENQGRPAPRSRTRDTKDIGLGPKRWR
ncbi:unnamed protein product, partial [Polarella glacialis]